MKKFQAITVALLVFQLALYAQTPLYYAINLGTFIDAKKDDFQTLHALGFLYSYQMENNYSQIFLGGFETQDAANAALSKVHAAGYTAAYVQERHEREGQTVSVVQITTLDTRKPIDWKKYSNFTNLWGIVSGPMLKLATGPYKSGEEARQAQALAQKQGFKDAFIRNINSVFLIKMGPFETNNALKQPLINFKWTEPAQSTPAATTAKKPESYDAVPVSTTPVPAAPKQQPAPGVQAKTPYPIPAEYSTPSPAPATPTTSIRSNIKRRSALELQKILKAENYYTGSLDGYYGAGTAQGYLTALQNNRELRKYQLLAQNMPGGSSTANPNADALQNAVNRLPEDARAAIVLESYNHPVAKAYQAYQLFRTLGPGNEVNQLMNDAIRQAYVSKSNKLIAPFDYRATYAYTDLDQLILHLYYIHAAPEINYSIPCWLSKQHPQETAKAQAAVVSYNSTGVQLQACDPFTEWQEIRMLETLSADIGGLQPSAKKLSEAASTRALLSSSNRPMSSFAQKEAELWHTTMLANLNNWASNDPLHQTKVFAFKVLYYQSQVRLEDYYMDRGFGSEEAKSFAIATLRTIVGPSLERFQ